MQKNSIETYAIQLIGIGNADTTIRVIETDEYGYFYRVSGTTLPTGKANYAMGATFTNSTTGAKYNNTGSVTSATWSAVGTVTSLTAAHILVGNAGNVATDVALSGDATMSNAGAITLKATASMAKAAIADPGTGQAIPVTSSGVCALTVGSAGAETNTLAAPSALGMFLAITLDVVGTGTRAITCATTINQTGNTVMTFAQAADTVLLYSTQIAGVLRWRVASNDGVALS